jgi:hypothetical protein
MPQEPAPLFPEQTFYGRPILPIAGGAADAHLQEPPTDAAPPPAEADPEVSVSAGDPLVALGLIDPKTGQALPTADWQPEGADAAPAPAKPAASTVDWDSPENPYKQRLEQAVSPVAQGRAYLAQKQAEISAQATAGYNALVAKGVEASVAEVITRAVAQAALAEARNEAEHIALGPNVREHVARDIAARFSTEGARIEPQELLSEESPEAMTAIARRLQAERRNQRARARSASGTDRVEGGVPLGSRIDYSKLTPQQQIKIGLARGQ